jgi:hypothetical protein
MNMLYTVAAAAAGNVRPTATAAKIKSLTHRIPDTPG